MAEPEDGKVCWSNKVCPTLWSIAMNFRIHIFGPHGKIPNDSGDNDSGIKIKNK